MNQNKSKSLLAAVILVALIVGSGGLAKLAGVPYAHASFKVLGLPSWFGYFIGSCEVLGTIALFMRMLRPLAAAGLLCIMAGASYFHIMHTPLYLGIPAFLCLLLCVYILAVTWSDCRSGARH